MHPKNYIVKHRTPAAILLINRNKKITVKRKKTKSNCKWQSSQIETAPISPADCDQRLQRSDIAKQMDQSPFSGILSLQPSRPRSWHIRKKIAQICLTVIKYWVCIMQVEIQAYQYRRFNPPPRRPWQPGGWNNPGVKCLAYHKSPVSAVNSRGATISQLKTDPEMKRKTTPLFPGLH